MLESIRINHRFSTVVLLGMSVMSVMTGCKKENVEIGDTPKTAEEKVLVSVSIPGMAGDDVALTKMTALPEESRISSYQVFVFYESGALETYAKSTEETVNLECTAGAKDFVVIANAPDITGVYDLTGLERQSSLLADNTDGGFVMSGRVKETIAASSNNVSVEVERIVARISVRKITNTITGDIYGGKPITIEEIYVANAAGDSPYLGVAAPNLWLNKENSSADIPELLSSGIMSDNTIEPNTSNEQIHYFYCYPNNTSSDSTAEQWSPRYTRLVLRAKIEGKEFFYPVSIPNICPNTIYDITDINITRPGSVSPDIPVTVGSITLKLTVVDWKTGTSTNIVI